MSSTAARGRRVVGAIVVAVAVIALGQLLWHAVRPVYGLERGGIAESAAFDLTAFPAALLALLVWLRLAERRPLTDLRLHPVPRPVRSVLIGAALAVALLLLTNVIMSLAGSVVGVGGGDDVADPAGPGPGAGLASGLLAVTAVQASTEELVYRGYLMSSLLRDLGTYPAVLLSSLAFGLSHAFNTGASVGYVAATFALGVLLGFIALGPGGLWMSCAFHTAWNAAQSIPSAGEPGSEQDGSGVGAGDLIWVFVAAVLCYAVVAALLLRRSARRAAPTVA
ncbi:MULTISPECIES: CPBP family intramembrane glutamic endopeptidase [unclassified Pseudonocardia]|uniref:CPBP family intramembrane glutamic endopeptidase n=1 Tax=unclassified Pseudonocardia TaxID=2619320 RepID=UPI00095BDBF4|nr:CPBP family intramembrane glutamic endopeptidase [Pseudonocardia sp. Ae707_Ps1]OLM18587.1 putative metal-dependent membrane protease [Pseudonocardia sp. Ae707_Ps1]